MSKLKQIDFFSALRFTKENKKVFVTILSGPKPITKLFGNLTIKEAIEHEDDYIYQIVEE